MTDKIKTIISMILGSSACLAIPLFVKRISKITNQDTIYLAIRLMLLLLQYIIIMIIAVILINIIISITLIVIGKLDKETKVDVALFPFYYHINGSKIEFKNIMFFMSNYVSYTIPSLNSVEEYVSLKETLKKRNKKIIFIALFCILLLSIVIGCFDYLYGYIFLLILMMQLIIQSKFQNINEPRGISLQINDDYMLQFISGQLCIQEIKISIRVLSIIRKRVQSISQYQFYKEIIISIIINQNLIVDEKVDAFIDETILKIVNPQSFDLYTYHNKVRDCINKEIHHFYEHYDILLLYIVRNKGQYVLETKEYVEKILERIKIECIEDSYLSGKLLENRYYEYVNLYEDALNGIYIFDHNFTKVKYNNPHRKAVEKQFLRNVNRSDD